MSKELKDRITILTTTHYRASAHRICDNYSANHDRQFTHTNLIEGVIKDLYDKIDCNNINHIVSLDHDSKDSGSNEYLNNLLKLQEKYPNVKIIKTEDGIYHSIRNLIHNTNTDYYLWWEHDWQFVNKINLENFINVMDIHDNVNYIRFNKRKTIPINCDQKLWEVPWIKQMHLTGTSGWSNNPYFGRKSKMLEWYKVMDESNENFHPTIEVFLQRKQESDIKRFGITKAKSDWGVYICGKMNDSQMVQHLNGKDK